MRKLIFLLLLMVGQFPYIFAQNDLKFGLQTGATISTFTTEVSISNAIASTIPPINEFNFSSNFNAGFWFEKRFNPFLALRWEVERSPGGAKAFDILEEREKRYKFFYISTPLLFKITALQKKVRYPIQLEIGAVANVFLFDYGEDITFGTINKVTYDGLIGLTKNLDNKWSMSIRYQKGLTPFSAYDIGGVTINWTNTRYVLSFSRALFIIERKS